MFFEGKRILVTGGTGSLGKRVVKRILGGELGLPSRVTVFSRDEAKQHEMHLEYLHRHAATDDIIYQGSRGRLTFRIGDVRDYSSILQALKGIDIVIHAAALKQVPSCEYFPYEAVQTNILGAQNLVRALSENKTSVTHVMGVSTDKACKPVNVMGMSKAVQERILVQANLHCPETRIMCARYGNVLASRGSVVPLFQEQIEKGGPVTITTAEMTRFLLNLDQAVDTIFNALISGMPGDTYIPKCPAALVVDVAEVLINGRDIPIVYQGIRPGEKVHEVLVSEEELHRTIERDDYYVIRPLLPELRQHLDPKPALNREFSSRKVTLDHDALRELLSDFISVGVP